MTASPKLTICVPSRNRQTTFQETIRSLVISPRLDIEFVFADNSDDPSIMNTFMQDLTGDPRVVYLPSAERVLSMTDNWERSIEAATGDYICVIGDDDYVDPDVVDVIERVRGEHASVDVFVWSRLNYNWPDNRRRRSNICIPLGTGIHKIKRAHVFEEFFSWQQHRYTPNCPFAIYHGAVSRVIMDKIKRKFGGRYFMHSTVDFENSCKVLVTAESLFYCERPFSILGACAASNSAAIGSMKELREKHAIAIREFGRNFDQDPYMRDFPFPSALGVTAAVAQVQHWFRTTYGYTIKGWEPNFARACAINCEASETREDFDLSVEGYRKAFEIWQGGRFLQYFRPVFTEKQSGMFYRGVHGDILFVDETIADVETPADLYRVVAQIAVPIESLDLHNTPYRKKAA